MRETLVGGLFLAFVVAGFLYCAVTAVRSARRRRRPSPRPCPPPASQEAPPGNGLDWSLWGLSVDVSAYRKLDRLFSPAEHSFQRVLAAVVADKALLYGKVRVADVLTPAAAAGGSAWRRAFNKINAKHFDFVLCSKEDSAALCAIELDDSSHGSAARRARDEFLDCACRSAGLPLLHVPAKRGYAPAELARLLEPCLGRLNPGVKASPWTAFPPEHAAFLPKT